MTVLDKGQLKKAPIKDGHDYEFVSPGDFFSYPANLVNGLGGVSGGRILIGSKATLQSISLVNRQPPLVQSVARHEDTPFVTQLGHNYLCEKSDVDGEVTEVSDHEIKVKTATGEKVFEIYHNHNLGQKTFVTHYPKVKVGDKVKKGDLLATSNYTDTHGVMALGTNLRTAVMPYRSSNFEDAFVVTESGAKKLEAEQMLRLRLEARMGIEINKNKYIAIFPNKFLNSQLASIDSNGVAKKGTILVHGDPIILALAPKALKSTDIALGKLSSVLKHAFTDHAMTWDYESPGEIVDVSIAGDYATVNVKTRRSLQVGDKISNGFGAKGITGSIISDTRAPMDKDGKPVDVILNSMSITSRVAPSLVISLATGKIAEKLGHPLKLPHFTKDSVLEHTIDELKKHGLTDTEELYDPVSGQKVDVLTGPLYFTRLVHIAEDKESNRSAGVGYCFDDKTDVLTRRGWVPWTAVQNSDEFFTVDSLTNNSSYSTAQEIIRQKYVGKMLGFEGKQLDYLVTPNHKFLFRPEGKTEFELKTAEEIHNKRGAIAKSGFDFVATSSLSEVVIPSLKTKNKLFGEVKLPINDFAKLAGLWVSEGSVVRHRGRVYVWQDQRANPVKFEQIQAFLNTTPFAWYVHTGSDGVNKGFSTTHKGLAEFLILHFGEFCEDRTLPSWLLEAGQEARQILLDYLVLGDGSCYLNGLREETQYFTCSKRLADSVQHLCLLLGKYASLNTRVDKPNPQYTLTVTETKTAYLNVYPGNKYRSFYEVDYDGYVYCAVLPATHTLYVRRNDVSYLSSNSWDHQPTKAEGECMTDIHECLTLEGWKNIKDVSVGDRVYSLSDDTITPATVVSTTAFYYSGSLYKVDTQNCKMEVTPDHHLPVTFNRTNNNPTYNLVPVSTLNRAYCYRLKTTGTWEAEAGFPLQSFIKTKFVDKAGRSGRPVKILNYTDDALFLLAGLFLGDGNCIWNDKSGNYGIELTQKKPKTMALIEKLLKQYNITYYFSKASHKYRFLSKTLATYFKPLGHSHEKYIPSELFSGSTQQLQLLYTGLLLTDGSTTAMGQNIVYTSSQRLAGDVQHLLFLLGKASTISMRPGGYRVKFPNGYESVARDRYMVYEVTKKIRPAVSKKQNVRMVPYAGMVYCITLDKNHIFYTRVNGKCHWTGNSSKRLGNLGTSALLSHGATAVLRDIATIKATRNDEYWRRLKLGLPVPSPQVPFIFNKFLASLQGAGINVTKKGTSFQILPMTDKDVGKISSGPIHEPLTFQVKGGTLIPEKGGLFDPEKIGVLGERYNHVELAQAIPNPVSEDFLRKLLGVTKEGYMVMIKSGEISTKLKAIDLDKELAKQLQYLKTGKKTKREDALKLVAFLRTLKEQNLKPADLMLTKIPIIPAIYRPALTQGDFSLAADVNYLYKDLLLTTNELRKDNSALPPNIVDDLKAKQYDAVKAVYGLGDPIVVKNLEKGIKGLLATTLGIHGGSAKHTMFQAKVVNKPMDLVGRAVLSPSAFLDLDQASAPMDTLWKIYQPFISRRLVQKGVPATKAQEYIQTKNPLAMEALLAEMQHRPAIVSRDPALHKFNLSGFYLQPNANKRDKTVKLNPLVFKSFAADNDGDQLNISVPASEEARLEVIDKMLPSRSLLSPKTFQPMFVPANESSLGLFQMSTESRAGTGKQFKTHKDVAAAFHRGEVHVGDAIKVD